MPSTDILKGPFGKLLAVLFGWHLALHLAIPLFALHWVNQIHLNDQEIGLGTAMFYVSVFVGSTQLARLVRRLGNRRVTAIGALFMSSYPAFMAMAGGLDLFLVGSASGGFGWALAGGALTNYLLEKIPEDHRPAYLAWYNLALNAALLLGSLVGPLIADQVGVVLALVIFAALARPGRAGYPALGENRHESQNPVLIAEGLTRRFGEVVAVDGLNLEVRAGEVFGFLGHNGAGKTTTVRLLNGVLLPDAGRARVLGLDPVADGPALRRRTGVLTETPSLDERLTGRENLTIYADLYGVPQAEVAGRVEYLLETFELADRADEKVGGYSKGMKQRLALARALLHQPEILFLDEPTAGLDPVAARRVHELITRLSREEQRTVFLCTHNLVEAQNLCDRVAVLEQGRLVALGTPAELARAVGPQPAPGDRGRAGRPAPSPEDRSRPIPGLAETQSRIPDTLVFTGADREAIPELVAALVAAGVRVYRVAPQEAALEDVYFALHSRRKIDLPDGRKHELARHPSHRPQGPQGRLSEQGGVDPPDRRAAAHPGHPARAGGLRPSLRGRPGQRLPGLRAVPGEHARRPAGRAGGLNEAQTIVVLMLVYMLAPMYLILPLMVSSVIAADSFAGEKERKTLEALLYTPTTDGELLLAKMLAAWLPALAIAWAGFVLYGTVANLAAWPTMGRIFFPNLMWIVLALWVAPAVAGLGLGVTVLVSVRAQSFQEAYQLGAMVVLPIMLLVIGQATGVMYFSTWLVLLLGAGGVGHRRRAAVVRRAELSARRAGGKDVRRRAAQHHRRHGLLRSKLPRSQALGSGQLGCAGSSGYFWMMGRKMRAEISGASGTWAETGPCWVAAPRTSRSSSQ